MNGFFATFITGFLGFYAGQVVFAGVTRWIATIYTLARDPSPSAQQGKRLSIVMATVFGSGPWLLVALAAGAYFIRDETYATTVYAGAALSIAVMSILTWRFARRHASAKTRTAREH